MNINQIRSITFWCLSALLVVSCQNTHNAPEDTIVIIRDIEPVSAASSYNFVNSIGVNTHFGFDYSNYHHKWDICRNRLLDLGVKHIRDGNYCSPLAEEHFLEIYDKGRIKLLLNINFEDPKEFMPRVKRLKKMLSGVEGVNEGDYTIDQDYQDTRPNIWVPQLIAYQKRLWEHIKEDQDSDINHLLVVGPSFANISASPAKVGDLLRDYMDYGNIHAYPSAAQDPVANWGWDLNESEIKNRMQILAGNKPIITTETGYHNCLTTDIKYHMGVPEDVSAVYSLHVLFEYFIAGIERTYLYEFLDQREAADGDIQRHFGMIRVDGTPKPAYTALQNLIALLNDDNELYITKPFEYELVCDNLPDKEILKHQLLQKSDGSWWVAIFRTPTLYDPLNSCKLECKAVNVKLLLDRKTKEIDIYRPNVSQSIQSSFKNQDEITFDLNEYLVLIRIQR